MSWGTGFRERNVPSEVRLIDGIVVDVGIAPALIDLGIPVDAKLSHEGIDYPKEGDVREVSDLYQVIKSIGA